MPLVKDRAASFIVDFFILLPPPLFLLIAPLRALAQTAALEEDLFTLTTCGLSIFMITLVSIFLYQTLSVYFFKKTLGQHCFGLSVTDADSFSKCALRSGVLIFEILTLGVFCLRLLTHPTRLTFHDLISETQVKSEKIIGSAPTSIEKAFGRGLQVGAALFIFCVCLATAPFAKNFIASFKVLDQDSCNTLQDSTDPLGEAVALYSADLLSKECLKKEAYKAIYLTHKNFELASLAMSLIYDDEAEVMNDYLAQSCRTQGDACAIATMIKGGALSAESKEAFKKLSLSQNSFALVWSIQYLFSIHQYDSALQLISKSQHPQSLKGFLLQSRVQSLLAMGHMASARMLSNIAIETLDQDEALNIASLTCFEQLENSCDKKSESSCDFIANKNTSSNRNLLAQFRKLECEQNPLSTDVFLKASSEDLKSFGVAMDELKLKNYAQAYTDFDSILRSTSSAVLKREITRQWTLSAPSKKFLKPLMHYAQILGDGPERDHILNALENSRRPASVKSK